MPPFTDNRANALIVRKIDAEYEPSSSATIDEHRIYDSAQLMRITTHATPGLEHQTQQHLAFALHAAETEGDPIIPDTVTPLTTRVGRTVIRAMTASGKTEVMRILAQSKISLDAFTKIQAHRQLFMDADLALPELQTGAVLTTWVPHGSNLPQTEILGYQIQSFEGDGVTWQDVIDGCQSEPDRQEARIEAYTEIGRIMLKLQGTTVRSPAHTGIPYGQYGTATTGEIRAWEDFSRYLNHTMGLHEFVQSAVNIAELPIKLDAKLINRAMYTIRQELLCATMVPHLVHGDLQPSNVLRNGVLIDPDYMSYGNTWNELAKPFGRIIQNHAASLALQQGLHHGLGLSKKNATSRLGMPRQGSYLTASTALPIRCSASPKMMLSLYKTGIRSRRNNRKDYRKSPATKASYSYRSANSLSILIVIATRNICAITSDGRSNATKTPNALHDNTVCLNKKSTRLTRSSRRCT